ncbi:MAG: hypothetical protein ABI406_04355 [Ktedonobacteraceae bacterium]
MNPETKAVADFLSSPETYTDILTIVQEAESDEQAAERIENYVTEQRRGPEELYQHFAQENSDFCNVDWIGIVQTFKSD